MSKFITKKSILTLLITIAMLIPLMAGLIFLRGKPMSDSVISPAAQSFNIEEHWDEIKEGVPMAYWRDLMDVRSMAEAKQFKARIFEELNNKRILENAGERGHIVKLIAALFDFPSLIAIISAFWIRNYWKLISIGIGAAVVGETMYAASQATYKTLEMLPYRLIAQLIVVTMAYWFWRKFKDKINKAEKPNQ